MIIIFVLYQVAILIVVELLGALVVAGGSSIV